MNPNIINNLGMIRSRLIAIRYQPTGIDYFIMFNRKGFTIDYYCSSVNLWLCDAVQFNYTSAREAMLDLLKIVISRLNDILKIEEEINYNRALSNNEI